MWGVCLLWIKDIILQRTIRTWVSMIKLNTNGTSVQSDKSMYKEKVMKRKTLFIIIVSLSLLCSCGSSEEEQQLLNSIEQAWQLGETALPEAQAHAEA